MCTLLEESSRLEATKTPVTTVFKICYVIHMYVHIYVHIYVCMSLEESAHLEAKQNSGNNCV